MRAPEVSVVIPSHRRETRLAFALEALAGQTLDADRYEVVVVRPAGAAGPRAGAPEGLNVRFLEAPVPSRPGQRNIGWRAAKGRLVAFTDDDCRPAPEWLEALLATASSGSAFVQGRTEPDPDERHLLFGLARSVEITSPTPWHETCNVAYPRVLLERLEGFDEAFVASGEDTDLGLRALDLGAERRFAPAALVHHAVLAQPHHEAVIAGWRRWHSTPLVIRRHPDQRRHLFARLFFNRTHATIVGALLGLVLARRRPVAAAVLCAPFVADGLDRDNLGPRGLARQLLHMPARLLRESAVAAGILRGAVRHRTPLI